MDKETSITGGNGKNLADTPGSRYNDAKNVPYQYSLGEGRTCYISAPPDLTATEWNKVASFVQNIPNSVDTGALNNIDMGSQSKSHGSSARDL